MHGRTLLLAALLALHGPLVGALTATPPSGQERLVYGDTDASILTDATTGELRLWKPSQLGDCRELVATINAEATGSFTGVHLDRAGYWSIDDSAGNDAHIRIEPAELRILVTPIDSGDRDVLGQTAWDYEVQLAQGTTHIGNAYIDLYFQGQFIRHLPTDSDGRAVILHEHLPYAGAYQIRAYKDLDEPRTAYLNAYTAPTQPPTCDPEQPEDEPELFGDVVESLGAPHGVERATLPLHLEILQPRVLIRGEAAATSIQASTPTGGAPVVTDVELVHDGTTRDAAELGLIIEVESGTIHLTGEWGFDGGLQIHAVHDTNQDGSAEYEDTLDLFVHPPRPIRMVNLEGQEEISFAVPPRDAETGKPGATELSFRLLDREGQQGRPPAVTAQDFSFTGDLLSKPLVEYDAAGEHWRILATPTQGDGTYHLSINWPDLGTVIFTLHVPPEAGARSTRLPPHDDLVAGQSTDVQVLVERVNDESSQAACRDAGGDEEECRYSTVPDAHVILFWADTGEALTWKAPDGAEHPVEYRPGEQQQCDCVAFNGRYAFRDLQSERSGSLVAHAVVDGNAAGLGRSTYLELPVLPEPLLVPVIGPSVALAGEQTRFQIRVPNSDYAADTLGAYETTIHDADGTDVTSSGSFSSQGSDVYWSAALDAGHYQVHVKDRLDPSQDLWGRRGTSTPADLTVLPAEIRFRYTEPSPDEETTPFSLLDAHHETYVLGGGFGDAVLLRVDVVGATSATPTGWITLDGTHGDGEVFAAFALADEFSQPYLQDEAVYAPGQPTWICDGAGGPGSECSATYTVQAPTETEFFGRLRFFYDGSPVHVYTRGLGVGDAATFFESARTSQSTVQEAHGVVHVVPPSIDIKSISTSRGQPRTEELGMGLDNLVSLAAWDPTGRHRLEGVQVGLARDLFGPGQRPGAMLQYGDGDFRASAAVGVTPDATGSLRVVVSKETRIHDTGVLLPIKPADHLDYDGSSIEAFIEVPRTVESGSPFQVRVATETDAFPTGVVVRAFDADHAVIRGLLNLQAPTVSTASDYELTVFLPDQEPRSYLLHVTPPEDPSAPAPMDPDTDVDPELLVDGIPTRARPSQSFYVRITNATNDAVPAATVQIGSTTSLTGEDGRVRITVPSDASGTLVITASKQGYATTESTLVVEPVVPRLELQGPSTLEPFEQATYRVTANTGTPLVDVRLSIETTWISLTPSAATWTGTYKAPALTEAAQVFAIARAPGYEEARLLVTIQGVSA